MKIIAIQYHWSGIYQKWHYLGTPLNVDNLRQYRKSIINNAKKYININIKEVNIRYEEK